MCVVAAAATAFLLPRTAPSAAARPLAIMPLGDSLTVGWPDMRYGGYRRLLGALLSRDGYAVRFVGSEHDGAELGAERAHEGHIGWTIPELKSGVDGEHWLETYRPDIVLLHIGTNDVHHGNGGAAPANLRALVDDIARRLPGAHILVAQIIPFQNGATDRYRAYVAAIPGIAASAGPRITVVDMRGILVRTDYTDELHPNAKGYDKMARAWETAIRVVMAQPAR